MTYALLFFGLVVIEAVILTAVVLLLWRTDMPDRPIRRITVEYEDGTVQVYQP